MRSHCQRRQIVLYFYWMFKDVQQLKISELENEVARLKAKQVEMESDVHNLQDRLHDLESQQEQGMNAYRGQKTFSAWERLVTKRKAYHAYQTKLSELKALPQKIAALHSQIEIAKIEAADQIASSGIIEQIEAAQNQVSTVSRATTLAQLGIAPVDAMTMLEDNGITPVLDESDRTIFERPRNYRTTDDLIAVHKMDLMPTDNRLSTAAEAKVKKTEKITLDGQEYEYSYLLERNTMHVSLNDEVSSHGGGNWDNCHYTVLQPLGEIAKSQIGSMLPNDTYTRGGIGLTENAWILCPAAEVETVKELNPNVHVLGYQAENSKGLAAPFLSQLGYRAESVGQWGWQDQESQQEFADVAKRANLQMVQHDSSTDVEDEDFQIAANKAIALIKMLRDENLIQTPQDYLRLKPQLEQQAVLSVYLNKILALSQVHDEIANDYRNYDAVVAKKQNVKAFSDKMSRAGMPLSADEIMTLRTRYQDQLEGTNNARYYSAGKELTNNDLVARVLVNSAIRSRTIETERSL